MEPKSGGGLRVLSVNSDGNLEEVCLVLSVNTDLVYNFVASQWNKPETLTNPVKLACNLPLGVEKGGFSVHVPAGGRSFEVSLR